MHSWLRVGLVLAIVSLGLTACSEDAEAVSVPEWASGVCSAQSKFTTAIGDSRDSVEDPSSLELAARKERAARLGEAEIAAVKQMRADYEAITPPAEVREYHKALIADAKEFAEELEVQVKAIEKATTAQQIAVANASIRFAREGSQTELRAKAADVSQDIIDVFADQEACGGGTLPGETATPGATPSA